ncbi:MAG: hypothetical protein NXI25_00130 [bacterium]|nr:hypothetical protein [bacterium]
MRSPLRIITVLLLLFFCTVLAAQPRAADVYREYSWIPDMVSEAAKFLRVAGPLDYRNPGSPFSQSCLKNGALALKNSLDLTDAIRAEVTLEMVHGMEVQYSGPMVKVKYRNQMPNGIRITEGYYQGKPHFIVHTPGAIYYYDKAGGGFSRLIDPEGKDWISFRPQPWGEYPASAASAFRGIPNLVYGAAEAGAGHPGHEQCNSEQTGPNKIRTTSGSGAWEWEWIFEPTYARLDILRVNPDAPYWFLYEGTPGGVFDPQRQFTGTDKGGPLHVTPDFYKGDKMFGHWQWAYFGHDDCETMLFIAQAEQDTLTDTFSYLGNSEAGLSSTDGMTVFGFGRADGARPLLTKINTFYLGFLEKNAGGRHLHQQARRSIKTILKAN